MALITIEEKEKPADQAKGFGSMPVWRLGFRPFYLLAAAFAVVSVPLWLARYFGVAQGLPHVGLGWHVHEMVFGFTLAVIIGFLYTAGRNWTGLWTPRGTQLAALAGLWIAGRLAMLGPPLPAAVVDLAFLPLATWPMYVVLKRSANRRNYFLLGLLGLLTLANACYHAAANGWLALSPLQPLHAAILVIVMLETVIAGRIIPGFTANALPGVKPVVDAPRDRIIVAFTVLACLAWVAGMPPVLTASLALGAAVSQLLRLAGWRSMRTLRNPLLWILHVSYGWIPVGFVLLGLAALGVVTASAAFHVLAIGALAGMIIGMLTRTALGHTGRPLKSRRSELVMYWLVQAGTLARLWAALDAGPGRNAALVLSAAAWSAAFLLYVIVYAPYLLAARVDGKEG